MLLGFFLCLDFIPETDCRNTHRPGCLCLGFAGRKLGLLWAGEPFSSDFVCARPGGMSGMFFGFGCSVFEQPVKVVPSKKSIKNKTRRMETSADQLFKLTSSVEARVANASIIVGAYGCPDVF